MALKLEQIDKFLGFGDGDRDGEYYLSQGMRYSRGGIKPFWTITGITATPGLLNWIVGRKETDMMIYGVNNAGVIHQVDDTGVVWTEAHDPATTSEGQGLIIDPKNRLLYAQTRYLGWYDGAWSDNVQDFGADISPAPSPRPMDNYESRVVIGNQNKVAMLETNDDSWNASAFTLPTGFVVRDIKAGRNGVLIGANLGERGVIILWDTLADRSIAPWIWTRGEIYSIAKHQGQWIVSAGNEFFITNGYSIGERWPAFDNKIQDDKFGPPYPSGMMVKDNYLFVFAVGGYGRKKDGLYIYNLRTRLWEFCPIATYRTYGATLNALFISTSYRCRVSYYDTVGRIARLSNAAPTKAFYITPKVGRGNNKKKAEGYIMDLTFDSEGYEIRSTQDLEIIAKIYDFKRQLWGYAQAKVNSANKDEITVDATAVAYNQAEVGDEITVLDGLNAGEIRHIASISGLNTSTEVWTLESELSSLTQKDENMNICPFKKIGTKTITTPEIKENRLYFPIKNTPTGKKFLIKVVFNRTGAAMTLRLNSQAFLYDNLGIL